MQINLSRIRYKGSYVEATYDSKTGSETYVPKFSFYYGIYQETQQYELQKQQVFGAYTTTFEILVRHDNRLKVNNQIQLQDKTNYDIANINEDPEINGFDIITVKDTDSTHQNQNQNPSWGNDE